MSNEELLEVSAKGDYRTVKQVPFVFQERDEKGSKIERSVVWDYVVRLFRISLETGEAGRALRFFAVGLSGVVVNLFFYRVFAAVPKWTVWEAATGAGAIAIVNNFAWNECFTFSEARKASPGVAPAAQRLLIFTLISLVGLTLNVGVVELLVSTMHLPWVPGIVGGITVAGAWNFCANANFTWKVTRAAPDGRGN